MKKKTVKKTLTPKQQARRKKVKGYIKDVTSSIPATLAAGAVGTGVGAAVNKKNPKAINAKKGAALGATAGFSMSFAGKRAKRAGYKDPKWMEKLSGRKKK